MDLSGFEPWLTRWRLEADGEPFASTWSQLLPVRREGQALMLKACMAEQEIQGSAFLGAYGGRGAVRVYEREADAVLMERAMGSSSLVDLALEAGEPAALRVICEQLTVLHAVSCPSDIHPISMETWFSALPVAAAQTGSVFADAAQVYARLAATTRRVAPLHGDLHHGNLLDGGPRGWLAIDPKGLIGDPVYDYAIMLCLEPAAPQDGPATAPTVARRSLEVADMAGLSAPRLLAWTCCHAALYSAWFQGHEGVEPWVAIASDLIADFGDRMEGLEP